MIDKHRIAQRMLESGVIAVVRAENADQGIRICRAVKEGGIQAIEVTLTVPGAIDVIRALREETKPADILLGAGTVLDPETARAAILAGADFIVSPILNEEMVRLCNRYQKICIPGAMTATEVVKAMEAGADLIKLFPGSAFGPDIVKAIKGPLPQANIIPTGGVSLENVAQWIRNGCVAVGVGGELTGGAKTGDYEKVTETARKFVDAVTMARKGEGNQ